MTTQEPFSALTAYDKWIQAEGIPLVKGYYVEDLDKVPVAPWPRKGGLGAFINLEGHEQANDAYICVIPPGESLRPQRHLYEEMILILNGRGATTVWNEGMPKQTFEWHDWSLFSIPLNAWHQHFNAQGDKPVKYVAVTSAPLTLSLFHNTDFIFNNDFAFADRYSAEQDYFSSQGTMHDIGRKVWESNFIPDVQTIKLYEWKKRGAGGTNITFELANNTMAAHISEFPVGTYKKAHRHGPAANVIVLNGEGYSLMWPEGQPRMKVDWHAGSMFVPPNRWFHQHFNTGGERARYLALRWGSLKNPMGRAYKVDESVKAGGDQIEYEDEDPEIRRLYEEELGRKGIQIKM